MLPPGRLPMLPGPVRTSRIQPTRTQPGIRTHPARASTGIPQPPAAPTLKAGPGKPRRYPKTLHPDGREYGRYKVKPNSQIPLEDLQAALADRILSTGWQPRFVKPLRDKSYTAFTFHVGSRKMEATKVLKEDLIETDSHIVFRIPAFKHGERAGPLELRKDLPGVDLIILQWQKTRKGRPIWPLGEKTAYRIIYRALGKCPHWLRHNFITTMQQRLQGTPAEADRKIMAWTGQKRRETLDPYRIKKAEDIREISDVGLG